jgi:hypothetical protein
MKCPPELLCELRASQLGDGRGSGSNAAYERVCRERRYFTLCRFLFAPPRMKGGREPAIEPSLTQEVVMLAPSVGDPLGVQPVCTEYLRFILLLQADDVSEQLTDAATATLNAARAAGFSTNRIVEFQNLCNVAVRRRQEAAQSAELDALAAEVEAGMSQFDAMSETERAHFARKVDGLTRRTRRFDRTRKVPPVPLRVRRVRARRPARRAAHRPSPRRSESDSGGDGDGDDPGDGDPPHVARSRRSQTAAPFGAVVRGRDTEGRHV